MGGFGFEHGDVFQVAIETHQVGKGMLNYVGAAGRWPFFEFQNTGRWRVKRAIKLQGSWNHIDAGSIKGEDAIDTTLGPPAPVVKIIYV